MVRAKKSMGQHFLNDPLIISQIIDALDPKPGETILEIGPGEGVLTLPLVNSEAAVVAVELDRRLAPELERTFTNHENFRVVEADVGNAKPLRYRLDHGYDHNPAHEYLLQSGNEDFGVDTVNAESA